MKHKLNQKTRLYFGSPAKNALQHVRLYPLECAVQEVVSGTLSYEGAVVQTRFKDQYGNHTELIVRDPEAQDVVVTFKGEVATYLKPSENNRLKDALPLWVYQRQTPLTRTGADIELVSNMAIRRGCYDMETLRALAEKISRADNCDDKINTFLGAARALGFSARYISGYLITDNPDKNGAVHTWSEVYVAGKGWSGFDVLCGKSPNENYVQLARGLDSQDAVSHSSVNNAAKPQNSVVFAQSQQ